MAVGVLAGVILLLDNVRERGPCPCLNRQVSHAVNVLVARWLKIAEVERSQIVDKEEKRQQF